MFNRDKIKGLWSEIKGKAKKESGNVRHDRSSQLEGAVQEKWGQARQGYGEADEQVKRSEPTRY